MILHAKMCDADRHGGGDEGKQRLDLKVREHGVQRDQVLQHLRTVNKNMQARYGAQPEY